MPGMSGQQMSTELHPVHWSVLATPLGRVTPRDMSRIKLPPGMKDELTNIALSIFADCSNAGVGFADALTAVYLSGLQHGAKAQQEN